MNDLIRKLSITIYCVAFTTNTYLFKALSRCQKLTTFRTQSTFLLSDLSVSNYTDTYLFTVYVKTRSTTGCWKISLQTDYSLEDYDDAVIQPYQIGKLLN